MNTFESSDGQKLSYQRAGEGSAMVLLHGLGSAAEDWNPQIEHFSRKYTVIAPDLRGHGQSDKDADDFSIERIAADVHELLDSLGVIRAQVIGLSMGGAVAFQLALDRPDLVDNLLIVNSGPSARPKAWRERLYIVQRRIMARLFRPSVFAASIANKLFPDDSMTDLRAQFIQRISNNNWRAYRKSIAALAQWSIESHVEKLTMPVVFITAEHDYTTPQWKQHFADRMSNAQVRIVPGTHHALPAEAPDVFNQVVQEYLLPA